MFFRRVQREDWERERDGGVVSGSILTTGTSREGVSDMVEEAGDSIPWEEDGVGPWEEGGASMPLVMASSRAARVWWTQ